MRLLGGLIKYAIENNRIARDYIINYTNAAFIVKDGFKLPEDGLYSGFDPATQVYDKSSWNYEEGGNVGPTSANPQTAAAASPGASANNAQANAAFEKTKSGARRGTSHTSFRNINPKSRRRGPGPGRRRASSRRRSGSVRPKHSQAAADASAKHRLRSLASTSSLRFPIAQEAVFTLHARDGRANNRHTERQKFVEVADLFTSVRKDGDMKKVATIIYAVGWTQHTFGTQMIRTAAMLQLLLGNIGRAGGGMNALRGHSNIQGATDMGGVFDIYPGYLKMLDPTDTDLATFLEAHNANCIEAIGMGFVQLLVEYAEVHGLLSQVDVRRRCNKRRTTSDSIIYPRSIGATRGLRCGIECTTAKSKACSPLE